MRQISSVPRMQTTNRTYHLLISRRSPCSSASFSNIGPILDVFCLGVDIEAACASRLFPQSTSLNSHRDRRPQRYQNSHVRAQFVPTPNTELLSSGTSMASPRVAGYLATALGKRGKTSPSDLSAALISHAQAVITGQPSNTTYAVTPLSETSTNTRP